MNKVITRPANETDYAFLIFLGVPRQKIKGYIDNKLEAYQIPAYCIAGPWLSVT